METGALPILTKFLVSYFYWTTQPLTFPSWILLCQIVRNLKDIQFYSFSLKSVHISPLGKVLDLNIYLPSLTETSNLSRELQESESYKKWSYSSLTEDPAHTAKETHQPALALTEAAVDSREQGKEKFMRHQTLLPGIWGWWRRKLNLNSLVFH